MSKKIINHRYSQNNRSKFSPLSKIVEVTTNFTMKITKTKYPRNHKNKSTLASATTAAAGNIDLDKICNVQKITDLRDKYKNYVKTETDSRINNLQKRFQQIHNEKADEMERQVANVAAALKKQTDDLTASYFEHKELHENWKKTVAETGRLKTEAMDKLVATIQKFNK